MQKILTNIMSRLSNLKPVNVRYNEYKLPTLGIMLSILGMYGCCSAPIVEPPIGMPICERPIAVDSQIWNDLGLLRETMSNNQLVDAQCIEKLRDRIERHDEAL